MAIQMQVERSDTRAEQTSRAFNDVHGRIDGVRADQEQHGANITALWQALIRVAAESDFDLARAVRGEFERVNPDTLA